MSKSEQLFERASHSIAGGVNSPVRAFRAVGGIPVFLSVGRKVPICTMLTVSNTLTISVVGDL